MLFRVLKPAPRVPISPPESKDWADPGTHWRGPLPWAPAADGSPVRLPQRTLSLCSLRDASPYNQPASDCKRGVQASGGVGGHADKISRARARAEPTRKTRSTRSVQPDPTKAAADQVSHRAASEPATFTGNGRYEVSAASSRGASQAARLQGNAGNAAHLDAGDGPRDSETLTGWARILERVPGREIGT